MKKLMTNKKLLYLEACIAIIGGACLFYSILTLLWVRQSFNHLATAIYSIEDITKCSQIISGEWIEDSFYDANYFVRSDVQHDLLVYEHVKYLYEQQQIEEEIRLGEMELLAQLIEAEAGNQDMTGKRLVADVVLNRAEDGWADGTIESVIFQRTGKTYQFSCIKDGGFNNAAYSISDESFQAAKLEYEASNRIDEDILYFTAGSYNPYCTAAYIYGDHYFGY